MRVKMLSKSETDEFLIAQQFKENALADLMKIYCTSDMNPTCRSFSGLLAGKLDFMRFDVKTKITL